MPSAWQGAWLGLWPGDWYGESEGGSGPAYVDAALTATGTGSAQFGAVVVGGTALPALPGGVFRRLRARRRNLYTGLRAAGTGSAQFGAVVVPPAFGRTARRRKAEHDLLLAA